MTEKRHIVLVMHSAPLESGFLMDKWRGLQSDYRISLLLWDRKARIRQLPDQGKGAYSGIYDFRSILENAGLFLRAFFGSGAFRKALFGPAWKHALRYLPLYLLQADQVHFSFGTLARDIAWLRTQFSASFSVSFRGYDLNYMGLDQPEYYKEVWNHAHGFHFLGQDLLNRARARGYADQGIVKRIPPGIPLSLFTLDRESARWRERESRLEIISVGRWVWKKDYGSAIRVMAMLRDQGLDFRYRLIGEGPDRQLLTFLIHELGLEKHIELLGSQTREQVAAWMRDSDVFVHTAISEGFGNALLEAQYMGLPVVAMEADGIGENIQDQETGFLIPMGELSQMAEKIRWLASHPIEARNMGQNGHARVRDHFSLDRLLKDFRVFFDQVYESSR